MFTKNKKIELLDFYIKREKAKARLSSTFKGEYEENVAVLEDIKRQIRR